MSEVPQQESPYLILHDFEDTPPGTRLDKWPLHTTIVPWFEQRTLTEDDLIELVANGTSFAAQYGDITLTSEGVDFFGPNNDIEVTRLGDDRHRLHNLHDELLDDLYQSGVEPRELTYTAKGNGYNPHVTHIPGAVMPEFPYKVRSVSLVQKLVEAGDFNKRIVARIAIGNDDPMRTGGLDEDVSVVELNSP